MYRCANDKGANLGDGGMVGAWITSLKGGTPSVVLAVSLLNINNPHVH
jgi:hypothetical protein